MSEDDGIVGDEPLVDGMNISLRYRRDFRVTDATRLLHAARQAFLDLHPGTTHAEAEQHVTCAADALFTILEHAGLLGGEIDAHLAARQSDGLQVRGSRARVVTDEPNPLLPGWNCLRSDDVFAVPTTGTDGPPSLVEA